MNKPFASGWIATILLSCFMAWVSCTPESQAIEQAAKIAVLPDVDCEADRSLLIFAQEGKLELWGHCGAGYQRLDSLLLPHAIDFPPGQYLLQSSKGSFGLAYPNTFYRSKGIQKQQWLDFTPWQQQWPKLAEWMSQSNESAVLVFPNDFRNGQRMQPCFACPHWMAELYGQLMVAWEAMRSL